MLLLLFTGRTIVGGDGVAAWRGIAANSNSSVCAVTVVPSMLSSWMPRSDVWPSGGDRRGGCCDAIDLMEVLAY